MSKCTGLSQARIATLERELKQTEKERDRAQDLHNATCFENINALKASRDAAKRHAQQLQAYTQHTPECQFTTLIVPVVVKCCGIDHQTYMGNRARCMMCSGALNTSALPSCTCGLAALLTGHVS